MMRTTLTRLLAGTAVAATVVVTFAGTAGAATTTPKAPTTLSIVLAHNSITKGDTDTVSGVLASKGTPLPGRTVEIERWLSKAKKWYGFEERGTGPKGGVAFVVRPAGTTSYRLVFNGGPNYDATHSATGTVVVKPFVKTPTVLSISQTPGTSNPGPGKSKTYDTISGQLTTAKGKDLGGQFVWLDKVVSGKLHEQYALRTGKLGKVSFKVSPAATTTYELVFKGTTVLAKSSSGTVTDTVS
jgi:hypothetical protein